MSGSTQGISFKILMKVLPHIIKQRLPILIRGIHGTGKSECIYQIAPKVPKILGISKKMANIGFGENDYKVLERRASQMPDAGDLTGLPFKENGITKFLPMEFIHLACTEPCVIFFDEVDRAKRDVRQALFELTDSRKLNGNFLHPDTVIFACCNGQEEDNGYQVGEFDPAELSRWAVFDFEPTVQDWLDYAKDKVDPIIWDFVKQQPSHLENKAKEFEPNKPYPCRRSWFRLSACLKETDMLDNPTEKVKGKIRPRMDLFFLAQSFVGNEGAIAFRDFVQNYKRHLTMEDIIDRGMFDKAKRLSINEHSAILDKYAESPLIKKKLSEKQLENLSRYMFIIDPELAMDLWKKVTRGNKMNGINMHQLVVDGESVSDYLARVNGNEI